MGLASSTRRYACFSESASGHSPFKKKNKRTDIVHNLQRLELLTDTENPDQSLEHLG